MGAIYFVGGILVGINSVGIEVEVGKGVMVGCRVIVGWAAGIFDSVFIDVCVGEISTALLVGCNLFSVETPAVLEEGEEDFPRRKTRSKTPIKK